MRWLLVLLIGCAAPTRTAAVSSTVVWRDDDALARSLERSLSHDAQVSIAAKNVRIATNGGVVLLAGSVATRDDDHAVRTAVDATPGVVATLDRLEISKTRDAKDEESDPHIARLIAANIHDPAVRVSCRHGIVKLQGQTRTDKEKREIEDRAQWIPGVIAVWNALDVK